MAELPNTTWNRLKQERQDVAKAARDRMAQRRAERRKERGLLRALRRLFGFAA